MLTLKFLKMNKPDTSTGLIVASTLGIQVAAQLAYGGPNTSLKSSCRSGQTNNRKGASLSGNGSSILSEPCKIHHPLKEEEAETVSVLGYRCTCNTFSGTPQARGNSRVPNDSSKAVVKDGETTKVDDDPAHDLDHKKSVSFKSAANILQLYRSNKFSISMDNSSSSNEDEMGDGSIEAMRRLRRQRKNVPEAISMSSRRKSDCNVIVNGELVSSGYRRNSATIRINHPGRMGPRKQSICLTPAHKMSIFRPDLVKDELDLDAEIEEEDFVGGSEENDLFAQHQTTVV